MKERTCRLFLLYIIIQHKIFNYEYGLGDIILIFFSATVEIFKWSLIIDRSKYFGKGLDKDMYLYYIVEVEYNA